MFIESLNQIVTTQKQGCYNNDNNRCCYGDVNAQFSSAVAKGIGLKYKGC
jgi:hypothetical protein